MAKKLTKAEKAKIRKVFAERAENFITHFEAEEGFDEQAYGNADDEIVDELSVMFEDEFEEEDEV